jgi:thymidine phosphorylase
LTSLSERDWPTFITSVAQLGCSNEEVAALALEYATSGTQLEFKHATADVASTGGPSSLSTLLAPLFLVQKGLKVPKLGVPGRPAGGLDALAQIPGYQIDFQPDEICRVIDACGYAHFISAGEFAPLDASTFKLRQNLGAQAVPELVIASLLSKKLAVGVKTIGLDVRIAAHGNFGESFDIGKRNAQRFIEVARLLGRKAVCILTDGSQPFQPFIGRGEALWAMYNVFENRADRWLLAHVGQCKAMAAALCENGNISATSPVAEFAANVEAQGGSYDGFLEKADSVQRGHRTQIECSDSGFVHYDLEKIRSVLTAANRNSANGSRFPDHVGVRLLVESGRSVRRGDPVMSVRVETEFTGEVRPQLSQSIIMSRDPGRSRGDELVE